VERRLRGWLSEGVRESECMGKASHEPGFGDWMSGGAGL
jgi:hypothetical protein